MIEFPLKRDNITMNQNTKTNEETKREEAWAFVETLKKKYSDDGYIFRGTTTIHSNETNKSEGGKVIYDGINSTLYRWVVRKEEKEENTFNDEEHEILRKIFSENPNFFPATMEKEISENARSISQSEAGHHGILTDLQHFGGKTNMIDFSRSIYIALFFACQGKFDKDGELIVLHEKELKKINKIDYVQLTRELETIAPLKTGGSQRRADSQKSVFVRPLDGYINPKKCKAISISAEIKKYILNYLLVEKKINHNKIYNDLHGFIKNQKNNETASLYFYMGYASQKKGDNGKAIVYYNKCIERNPYAPVAYNNRGNAHNSFKDHKQAIEDYQKALLLNPYYVEAYNNQGIAYKDWGKFDLAMESFGEALSLNPSYVQAYNNRGNAYNENGQYDLAVRDFEEAISIEPYFAPAHFNLGIAFFHQGKIKDSIKSYSKAISFRPNDAAAHLNRGVAYYFLKKIKRAIKDYDKAILLDSNFGDAYYNRAGAKELIGDKEGAKADFAKAKKLGFMPQSERLAIKSNSFTPPA